MDVLDKRRLRESTRALRSMRNAILKHSRSIPVASEVIYLVSGLHINCSKKEESQQISGLFISEGLRGCQKEKSTTDRMWCFLSLQDFYTGAMECFRDKR